jgi:hypothetical protein
MCLGLAAASGCKEEKKDDEGKPASTAAGTTGAKGSGATTAASAPPAPTAVSLAGKKTCKDWGAEGAGTFFENCDVKGASPFRLKWTGNYAEDFGEQKPEFEVVNLTDKDIVWGNVSYWYYDKDGKVIEVKLKNGNSFKEGYENGDGVLPLEAKETKKLTFGVKKEETPPGTTAIEAEVLGWAYVADGEEKLFIRNRTEIEDRDERPLGGWK